MKSYMYKPNQSVQALVLALLTILSLSQCKDDDAENKEVNLQLQFTTNVQGNPLITDSILYTNSSGNAHSITRLQYYLSNFKFHHVDKGWVVYNNPEYHDAINLSSKKTLYTNLPPGSYDSVAFLFGLPAILNKPGGLPNEKKHVNMTWPENFGGGYHFLKLEGRFIDDKADTVGYTFHIGTNTSALDINMAHAMELNIRTQTLTVDMDVNEWFQNPTAIDLNLHNYTMGIDSSMQLISQNAVTVFKIKTP